MRASHRLAALVYVLEMADELRAVVLFGLLVDEMAVGRAVFEQHLLVRNLTPHNANASSLATQAPHGQI